MREVMIYDPGDKVQYVGEKSIEVVLPRKSAYIAGRGEIGSDSYNEAVVEQRFTLLPQTDGVVVPNVGNFESSEYATVKFQDRGYVFYIPIYHTDLEPKVD